MTDLKNKAKLIFAKDKNTDKSKALQPNKAKSGPEVLTLPVIPIREGVLFPSTESILTFGRSVSIAAIKN
ncbi:MAG: hypothetical protein ABFQ62_05170, partial [Patescibacteria group bacterium]